MHLLKFLTMFPAFAVSNGIRKDNSRVRIRNRVKFSKILRTRKTGFEPAAFSVTG